MRAASMVALAARGCGHRMSELRVLSASRALKMAVEVGLVVGTIPGWGNELEPQGLVRCIRIMFVCTVMCLSVLCV